MKIFLYRLYKALIAPKQRDEDLRNRELVLNLLLAGTLSITLLAVLQLVIEIITADRSFLWIRVLTVGGIAAYIGSLYVLSRRGWHKTAAALLVTLYFFLALALVFAWSVYLTVAALLFSLVIVLAGILLGPKYSLYAMLSTAAGLTVAQQLANNRVIHPDLFWTTQEPQLNDVIGFCLVLAVIALVSWLFNHQMERSLHRAERAEVALLKQKSLLETTVEQRTRELQDVQLEKIQQMYRFAELGQLSTAMMHDLSNHLTTLTLDIEGLQGQGRSRVLNRAKRSIRYIDDMVVRVRDQLHGKSNDRPFNVVDEVDAVVKMLRHRAQARDVILKWEAPEDKKTLRALGEPIRMRQLIANLISNAIDAYYEPRNITEKRDVQILVTSNKRHLILRVSDWGRGIPKAGRGDKLFEPFFSTKEAGMGMGLYIVKQVAEEHFLGSVEVDESKDYTSFVVTLPRAGV